MEKKNTPKKILPPVIVLPEKVSSSKINANFFKVLEWKAKQDKIATILREVLN